MTATVAQLRILVDDPDDASKIFEDSHYEGIIAIESNVFRAAATAARTLAAYFSRKVSVAAGPVRVESQHKFKHYMSLAASYDQSAREGGGSGADTAAMAPGLSGVSISDIESNNEDDDRYKGAFSRELDVNE